jgi:hypothetical protein
MWLVLVITFVGGLVTGMLLQRRSKKNAPVPDYHGS